MAYDPVSRQVLMFGGLAEPLVPLDDTWTWDGATWTERHPGTSPPARWGARMAHDPARGEVVLFGGYGLNDTWIWNGTSWMQQTPPISPPLQGEVPGLAFDAFYQARRSVQSR